MVENIIKQSIRAHNYGVSLQKLDIVNLILEGYQMAMIRMRKLHILIQSLGAIFFPW